MLASYSDVRQCVCIDVRYLVVKHTHANNNKKIHGHLCNLQNLSAVSSFVQAVLPVHFNFFLFFNTVKSCIKAALKCKLHFLQTQVAQKPHSNRSRGLKTAAQYRPSRANFHRLLHAKCLFTLSNSFVTFTK